MGKPTVFHVQIPEKLRYRHGILISNVSFLREYLARYLSLSAREIHLMGNNADRSIAKIVPGLPAAKKGDLQLTILGFSPCKDGLPVSLLSAKPEYWPYLIDCGVTEKIRQKIRKQRGYLAFVLEASQDFGLKPLDASSPKSKVTIWLDAQDKKNLGLNLLSGKVFSECYFDQQVKEVCYLYAGDSRFSPSLN